MTTDEAATNVSRDDARAAASQTLKRRVVATAVTLLLYLLSFGPMYWTWYASKFIGGSPFWAAVYEPLYLTASLVPPVGWVVASYADLWIS